MMSYEIRVRAANQSGVGDWAREKGDVLDWLDKRPPDIPLPFYQMHHDGNYGLYWEGDEVFAEVEFEGNRTFSYFAVHGHPNDEKEKCGGDGVPVDAPWPDDLLIILRLLPALKRPPAPTGLRLERHGSIAWN